MKRMTPRRFERRAAIGDAFVRRLTSAVALPASVLNLAQSGAALFAPHSLVIGETVEVSFPLDPAADSLGVGKRDARVVRSRAHTDGNVLGIVFTRPLTTEEFAMLQARWRRS
jgi:hypothetical protein